MNLWFLTSLVGLCPISSECYFKIDHYWDQKKDTLLMGLVGFGGLGLHVLVQIAQMLRVLRSVSCVQFNQRLLSSFNRSVVMYQHMSASKHSSKIPLKQLLSFTSFFSFFSTMYGVSFASFSSSLISVFLAPFPFSLVLLSTALRNKLSLSFIRLLNHV